MVAEEMLLHVADIIQNYEPTLVNSGTDEIEIDLETVQPTTIDILKSLIENYNGK